MIIQLPNGQKLTLEENIEINEKLLIVENLIIEWNPYLRKNWSTTPVRFFLDGLANYLVWHKDANNKNKHDKEILSVFKVNQMDGKRKANSVPFSSLSTTNKEALGLDGDHQYE